jgi:replicative DNA helicase
MMNELSVSWSPEAETGLVGAILIDNSLFDSVADILRPTYFHDADVGAVYASIEAIIVSGGEADVITVHERLRNSHTIDLPFIHSLTEFAGTSRSVRRYAELVAEKALGRKLLSASAEVQSVAMDMSIPVAERIGVAQAKLESLQENSIKSVPQRLDRFVTGAIDRISELADGKIKPGIPTQIPALDRLLGGGLNLKRREYIQRHDKHQCGHTQYFR